MNVVLPIEWRSADVLIDCTEHDALRLRWGSGEKGSAEMIIRLGLRRSPDGKQRLQYAIEGGQARWPVGSARSHATGDTNRLKGYALR
jgi:hypothetical protein